MTKHSKLGNRR
jgi:hypothetical protein